MSLDFNCFTIPAVLDGEVIETPEDECDDSSLLTDEEILLAKCGGVLLINLSDGEVTLTLLNSSETELMGEIDRDSLSQSEKYNRLGFCFADLKLFFTVPKTLLLN